MVPGAAGGAEGAGFDSDLRRRVGAVVYPTKDTPLYPHDVVGLLALAGPVPFLLPCSSSLFILCPAPHPTPYLVAFK